MYDDDWMDETIPTRGAEPAHQDEERASQPGIRSVPTRVWVLGLLVALVAGAIAVLWGLYFFRGRFTAGRPTPTAIIWTPTPSPVPTASPSSTPTEPPSGEETGEATPTASPDIAIGRYVQVKGTGGYGLSLREGPGTNYTRQDVAAEEEVFIVVEGPTTADGSEWWRIRDPEDEGRAWWAIANYLEPVEHP